MTRTELIALLCVAAYVALFVKSRFVRKHLSIFKALWWLIWHAFRAFFPKRTVYRDRRDAAGNYIGKRDPRRTFSPEQKAEALDRDGPRCQCHGGCRSHLHAYPGQCVVINGDEQYLEGGHVVAWAEGGKTEVENLKMLCTACNKAWSSRTFTLPTADERFAA